MFGHTGILKKTALMAAASLMGKQVDYMPTEWVLESRWDLRDGPVSVMLAKTRMAKDITWVKSHVDCSLAVYADRPTIMGVINDVEVVYVDDDKEKYDTYCALATMCGFKVIAQ